MSFNHPIDGTFRYISDEYRMLILRAKPAGKIAVEAYGQRSNCCQKVKAVAIAKCFVLGFAAQRIAVSAVELFPGLSRFSLPLAALTAAYGFLLLMIRS